MNKRRSFAKSTLLYVVLLSLVALMGEGLGFLYYKLNSKHPIHTDLFQKLIPEVLQSSQQFTYHRESQLIFPKPHSTIVTINLTDDVVDRFPISADNNLPGLRGVGLYDDGINHEKTNKFIAIGDSFTRGVGAQNNIQKGWVELVEQNMVDTDILNLGQSGGSTHHQLKFYNQIKKHLSYDLVLLNFFTGDYFDNVYKFCTTDQVVKELAPEGREDQYLAEVGFSERIQVILGYPSYLYSYYYSNTFRSHLVMLSLQFLDRFLPRQEFPHVTSLQKAIAKCNATEKDQRNIDDPGFRFTTDDTSDPRFQFRLIEDLYDPTKQQTIEWTAKLSASAINQFAEAVRSDGKQLLVIVHPSKERVYQPGSPRLDFDYIHNHTLQNLKKDLEVFDLTEKLRSHADKMLYYKYDGHYNPLGYQIVADYIHQRLMKIHPRISSAPRTLEKL